MSWDRLIQFKGEDGNLHYGDPIISSHSDLETLLASGQLKARRLTGPDITSLKPTGQELSVKEITGPLSPSNVPIVRCIGLNYQKHIQEGGRKPPPYPSIFIKGSATITSWNADVLVPTIVHPTDELDYEGEMCIVIAKTGSNIPADKVEDYILGYTAGNDVSARKWQRDPAFAGGVPQWCFAKGFDGWCPVGPMIVSPKVLGLADKQSLRTWVNGDLRQDSDTSDLLFGVKEIVQFASQGTTLEAGSVIMTGTPAGVAMGMAEPKYLKDGDVVEIEIGGVGKIRNRMVFAKDQVQP
ncbi:hypothetical protein SLS60_000429 [Paraconiothyrium brasiliense]|uniref:Fumarylacetoacetase-like C-terminal domain-containing protein n=1 Tax=Paraconiothyrium brasiliense TaxID=300254 RepID=A0ABR3S677_9PLEO